MCIRDRSQEEQQTQPQQQVVDGSGDKVHLLFGHGVCKWPGCETAVSYTHLIPIDTSSPVSRYICYC